MVIFVDYFLLLSKKTWKKYHLFKNIYINAWDMVLESQKSKGEIDVDDENHTESSNFRRMAADKKYKRNTSSDFCQ